MQLGLYRTTLTAAAAARLSSAFKVSSSVMLPTRAMKSRSGGDSVNPQKNVKIIKKYRELGLGPSGFYRPGYNDGAKLRLHMMCLGLDWNAQTREYGKIRHHDNATPPDIPHEFTSLVSRVFNDSHNLIKRDLKMINVEDVIP